MICIREPSAFAVSITPVGGFAFPSILNSANNTSAHPRTILFGGTIQYQIAPRKVELEWGVIYSIRGYIDSSSTPSNELSFTTFQFPLLLRFFPASWFYLGFGGYFSHGVGGINSTPQAPDSVSSSPSYPDASLSKDDYGFLINIGFKINLVKGVSLILDTRFLNGLRSINQAEGGSPIFLQDLQTLVGIRFGS